MHVNDLTRPPSPVFQLKKEPRYAFLDEATSAVSPDVEALLYEGAKAKQITLITISTRASLKKHHTYNLTLGGLDTTIITNNNNHSHHHHPTSTAEQQQQEDEEDEEEERKQQEWTLERIGTPAEKFGVERELAHLRHRLGQVDVWTARLRQLDVELGRVWIGAKGKGEVLPPPPSHLPLSSSLPLPSAAAQSAAVGKVEGEVEDEDEEEEEAEDERGKVMNE